MINPMAFWSDQNHLYDASDSTQGDAKLNAWLQTPGSSTDISAPARLGYGALTVAPRAVEGLAATAGSVGHWLGLNSEAGGQFLPQLPAGTTGGQQAADMASGLMPLALELPLMGGPLAGLADVSGLTRAAPAISRALVQGGEFAGLAAQAGDAATTGEQFGEGSMAGAITALMSRGLGRTAAAAALGIGSKMFFDRDGGQKIAGDWTAGDISGTALGLTTAFMGKPVKWTRPVPGEIPTRVPQDAIYDAFKAAPEGFQPNSAVRRQASPPDIYQAFGAPPVNYNVPLDIHEAFARQQGVQPGVNTPDIHEAFGAPPLSEGVELPQVQAERQRLAQQMIGQMSTPPSTPLLAQAGADNPFVQMTDMHAAQTLPQILNRTPGEVVKTPFGYQERPVTIPMEGPVGTTPIDPTAPDYITQKIFNPANAQLVNDAAFSGHNPDLLHQGEMGLQALQTQWFAQDVQQANKQQTINLMNWMHGLEERATVTGADPLTKLARSPNLSVDDLATELRAHSPSEREALGRELGVNPDDTMALAQALKEKHDASLRPRTPPATSMSDADMQAMLTGEPPNPNLSPAEQAAYNRFKSEGGSVDPALLYAGARGLLGAGAGYAIGGNQNMSEGDKWLAAAAIGGAALFGPALIRTLGHTGEAEAKIPTWGRPVPQRTALSIEPPPRNTNNPRLNEITDIEHQRAATGDNAATLQRLQVETTRKGKVGETPSWLRNEGGYTSPELSAALGRASVGAVIGGYAGGLGDDPGSHTGMAAGAVGGALLSMFGPMIIKRMLAETANTKTPEITSTPTVASVLSKTAGVQPFSLPTLLAQAKMAVDAPTILGRTPTMMEKALSRFDYWTGANLGPKFSRVLNQASGPASYLTDRIDQAFHKISLIDSDVTMRDTTTKFLNGEMSREDYQKAMAVDSRTKAYADFAMVAKDSMIGLKELIARGVGNDAKAEMLRTTDNYLTRSYRMFVDKSYSPSVESTQKLAQRLFETGAWADTTGGSPSVDEITSRLNQYAKEVQQMKGIYKPTDSGKKIDQSAFGHRKEVDPEWKQFLGEITDPQDRIRLTVLKLKPMAEASNFMHQVANGLTLSDEGLRFTFSSSGELEAAKASVLQALQKEPTNPQLRKQLIELQQYKFVEQDARYGSLQGQYVHRNVYDVMNEWDQSTKMDSAAGRALTGINQFMKSNVTYRNPMGIIRQAVTTPFFLQAGRGFGGMGQAWDVMRNTDHPLRVELMNNGILNVDQVTKDVLRDVDHLTNNALARAGEDGAKAFIGRIDHALAKAGAMGRLADSKMADLFKVPDNFNRVAIYLAAKTRFAEKLGMALDSTEVINAAVEHTNRYSMNYSLLPKAVVLGRNVPFVNMFISYASEMGRILKNLGEDMVKSDTPGDQRFNAIASLATMLALPEAMQRLSESSLSEKDKKDWETAKAGMPIYAKDRYYIVQGRDQATGKFRIYDISKLLPADQFQQTARALSEGRMTDAAKNNPVIGWDNNPALNIAGAFMYGEDRVSGRKLRGTPDYLATIAKEAIGPFAPGEGSMVRRYHQTFDVNADGTRGITDKRGRQLSTEDFWMDTLAQVRSSNLDPKVIQQSVAAQYKQDVANEMSYANDILKSKYPQEVKDRAMQRTKEALNQIQMRFNQQTGVTPKAEVSP